MEPTYKNIIILIGIKNSKEFLVDAIFPLILYYGEACL